MNTTELDAGLRQQFNIFGVKPQDLAKTKYKSVMKEEPARLAYRLWTSRDSQTSEIEAAVQDLGPPLIAKPDNGVGAAATYKLMTPEDVDQFKATWGESTPYFLEQFVSYPTVTTFDALIDARQYCSRPVYLLLPTGIYSLSCGDNALYWRRKSNLASVNMVMPSSSFGMKERFFPYRIFPTPTMIYRH